VNLGFPEIRRRRGTCVAYSSKYCPCHETLRPPGELKSLSNGWHLLPDGNKREKAAWGDGLLSPFCFRLAINANHLREN
jgi:hypothetical protein